MKNLPSKLAGPRPMVVEVALAPMALLSELMRYYSSLVPFSGHPMAEVYCHFIGSDKGSREAISISGCCLGDLVERPADAYGLPCSIGYLLGSNSSYSIQ
ncbi:hypothetical protein QYF36_009338 [Acer negundo]|nr:hypothetical protein QYF36_009338 [Acer negundo]